MRTFIDVLQNRQHKTTKPIPAHHSRENLQEKFIGRMMSMDAEMSTLDIDTAMPQTLSVEQQMQMVNEKLASVMRMAAECHALRHELLPHLATDDKDALPAMYTTRVARLAELQQQYAKALTALVEMRERQLANPAVQRRFNQDIVTTQISQLYQRVFAGGLTALHLAVLTEDTKLAKKAARHIKNADAKDDLGMPAVVYALHSPEMLAIILHKQANLTDLYHPNGMNLELFMTQHPATLALDEKAIHLQLQQYQSAMRYQNKKFFQEAFSAFRDYYTQVEPLLLRLNMLDELFKSGSINHESPEKAACLAEEKRLLTLLMTVHQLIIPYLNMLEDLFVHEKLYLEGYNAKLSAEAEKIISLLFNSLRETDEATPDAPELKNLMNNVSRIVSTKSWMFLHFLARYHDMQDNLNTHFKVWGKQATETSIRQQIATARVKFAESKVENFLPFMAQLYKKCVTSGLDISADYYRKHVTEMLGAVSQASALKTFDQFILQCRDTKVRGSTTPIPVDELHARRTDLAIVSQYMPLQARQTLLQEWLNGLDQWLQAERLKSPRERDTHASHSKGSSRTTSRGSSLGNSPRNSMYASATSSDTSSTSDPAEIDEPQTPRRPQLSRRNTQMSVAAQLGESMGNLLSGMRSSRRVSTPLLPECSASLRVTC